MGYIYKGGGGGVASRTLSSDAGGLWRDCFLRGSRFQQESDLEFHTIETGDKEQPVFFFSLGTGELRHVRCPAMLEDFGVCCPRGTV